MLLLLVLDLRHEGIATLLVVLDELIVDLLQVDFHHVQPHDFGLALEPYQKAIWEQIGMKALQMLLLECGLCVELYFLAEFGHLGVDGLWRLLEDVLVAVLDLLSVSEHIDVLVENGFYLAGHFQECFVRTVPLAHLPQCLLLGSPWKF